MSSPKIEDLTDRVIGLNVAGLAAEPDFSNIQDVTVDLEATAITSAGQSITL